MARCNVTVATAAVMYVGRDSSNNEDLKVQLLRRRMKTRDLPLEEIAGEAPDTQAFPESKGLVLPNESSSLGI